MSRFNTIASSRAFFPENLIGAPRVCYAPETGAGAGSSDSQETTESSVDEAAKAAAATTEATKEPTETKTPDAEKAGLLREVMEKKAKLKDAEKKAADAEAAVAAYGGVNPDKVKELLKKEADAEKAAAEAKGDFDRVKAMMAEEHDKEKKRLEDELEAERAARRSDAETIMNLTIGNDFGSSVFIRESLTLTPNKARQLYGAHFEIQNGRTVAFNKTAGSADRTLLVDGRGEPLGFEEALKRIIDADPDKDTLLKVKVNSGSGSRSDAQATKSKSDNSKLYGVARIAASLNAGSSN